MIESLTSIFLSISWTGVFFGALIGLSSVLLLGILYYIASFFYTFFIKFYYKYIKSVFSKKQINNNEDILEKKVSKEQTKVRKINYDKDYHKDNKVDEDKDYDEDEDEDEYTNSNVGPLNGICIKSLASKHSNTNSMRFIYLMNTYSKKELYNLLSVPEIRQGGAWNKGHHNYKVENELDKHFIFANIDKPGKGFDSTSYNYDNYINSKLEFVWVTEKNRKQKNPIIQSLIKSTPFIFIRNENIKDDKWLFIGEGLLKSYDGDSPVKMIWELNLENSHNFPKNTKILKEKIKKYARTEDEETETKKNSEEQSKIEQYRIDAKKKTEKLKIEQYKIDAEKKTEKLKIEQYKIDAEREKLKNRKNKEKVFKKLNNPHLPLELIIYNYRIEPYFNWTDELPTKASDHTIKHHLLKSEKLNFSSEEIDVSLNSSPKRTIKIFSDFLIYIQKEMKSLAKEYAKSDKQKKEEIKKVLKEKTKLKDKLSKIVSEITEKIKKDHISKVNNKPIIIEQNPFLEESDFYKKNNNHKKYIPGQNNLNLLHKNDIKKIKLKNEEEGMFMALEFFHKLLVINKIKIRNKERKDFFEEIFDNIIS